MNNRARVTPDNPAWIFTDGTVTSCRYQFARMNTFTLGISRDKKFRITFDYHAHGQTYSDEFQSATAVPQNQKIEVIYNPLAPEQNTRSYQADGSHKQNPLIPIAIAGSVVLSLIWFEVLRGCQ